MELTEYEKLDKKLDHMIEYNNLRFDQLDRALKGDEYSGTKGMIQRQTETEQYIEQDKKIKQKIAGGILVLSAVGSVVIWGLTKLWDKIIGS